MAAAFIVSTSPVLVSHAAQSTDTGALNRRVFRPCCRDLTWCSCSREGSVGGRGREDGGDAITESII